MMLHIDASKHAWFGDGRYYDLITILDDATSKIYYAQLVEEDEVVPLCRHHSSSYSRSIPVAERQG
jgi:hypothetical protein